MKVDFWLLSRDPAESVAAPAQALVRELLPPPGGVARQLADAEAAGASADGGAAAAASPPIATPAGHIAWSCAQLDANFPEVSARGEVVSKTAGPDRAAVEAAGFKLARTEMTGTNFYFSRLFEAVKA